MINEERALLLEEELLLIRHSGEIPEVALHSSLCYITEDADGPGLLLTGDELHILHLAVRDRYLEIILRDLDPDNRDLSLYRGLGRAAVNWRRLATFAQRTSLELHSARDLVGRALRAFLVREMADVTAARRCSCLNCCAEDVAGFIRALDLLPASLPEGWQALCVPEDRQQTAENS